MGHDPHFKIDHRTSGNLIVRATDYTVGILGARLVADTVVVGAGILRDWSNGTKTPSDEELGRLTLLRDVLTGLQRRANGSVTEEMKAPQEQLGGSSLVKVIRSKPPQTARNRIAQALGLEL